MTERLEAIARALVAPGKGILAADESTATIKKRFDKINHASTEDSRRDYREMMFRTTEAMKNSRLRRHPVRRDHPPEGKRRHAAGRHHEGRGLHSRYQGRRRRQAARRPDGKNRNVTEGLDGLRERLAEYHKLGARFAKWRGVITIADGMPTWNCVKANAHALARYAALCQEAAHRAHRRARGADGRRSFDPHHRPLLRGDRVDAAHGVPRAL